MELEICYACHTFLAYDEPNEIVADRIRERWGHDIDRITVDGKHLGISWSPCDTCGTFLGGDRFAADFVVRDRAR